MRPATRAAGATCEICEAALAALHCSRKCRTMRQSPTDSGLAGRNISRIPQIPAGFLLVFVPAILLRRTQASQTSPKRERGKRNKRAEAKRTQARRASEGAKQAPQHQPKASARRPEMFPIKKKTAPSATTAIRKSLQRLT